MQTTRVAEGVHRLAHSYVNCYLIEGADGLSLIDTGLPAMWPMLGHAVHELGHRPSAIAGIVLTHAHFDHVGMAARAQRTLGAPIWAHPDEQYLAAHPYRYSHENFRALYPLRYPASIPTLLAMVRAGALRVRGVSGLQDFEAGQTLDLPGSPRVVFTPGHTFGHCALHLPDRDVVISGDALVTLDPYTNRTGPHIVAGAATADSDQALRSLDELAATSAGIVLPGHGEPWTEGVTAAVEQAQWAGAA